MPTASTHSLPARRPSRKPAVVTSAASLYARLSRASDVLDALLAQGDLPESIAHRLVAVQYEVEAAISDVDPVAGAAVGVRSFGEVMTRAKALRLAASVA